MGLGEKGKVTINFMCWCFRDLFPFVEPNFWASAKSKAQFVFEQRVIILLPAMTIYGGSASPVLPSYRTVTVKSHGHQMMGEL